MTEEFVEIGDDLVEEAETLYALIVAVQFDVELVKVGDGGKEDADPGIALMVQFQVAARIAVEEVGGHVRREQVEEDAPVAVLQGVHLLLLLLGLALPQEVQPGRPLHLAAVEDYRQEEEQQLQRSHGPQGNKRSGALVVAVQDRLVGQVEEQQEDDRHHRQDDPCVKKKSID